MKTDNKALDLRTRRSSRDIFSSLNELHEICTSDEAVDITDTDELISILKGYSKVILEKYCTRIDELLFEGTDVKSRQHSTVKHPAAVMTIYSLLVCVADSLTDSGSALVSFYGDKALLEVSILTKTSNARCPMGLLGNVSCLAEYAPECERFLIPAVDLADKLNIFINAERGEDNITVSFGTKTDSFPMLDFKFRDVSEREIYLTDLTGDMLSAILDK